MWFMNKAFTIQICYGFNEFFNFNNNQSFPCSWSSWRVKLIINFNNKDEVFHVCGHPAATAAPLGGLLPPNLRLFPSFPPLPPLHSSSGTLSLSFLFFSPPPAPVLLRTPGLTQTCGKTARGVPHVRDDGGFVWNNLAPSCPERENCRFQLCGFLLVFAGFLGGSRSLLWFTEHQDGRRLRAGRKSLTTTEKSAPSFRVRLINELLSSLGLNLMKVQVCESRCCVKVQVFACPGELLELTWIEAWKPPSRSITCLFLDLTVLHEPIINVSIIEWGRIKVN